MVQSLIYQNIHIIKNARHNVILQWVYGHSEVLGNEKADAIIKNVAYKREKVTNHLSLLIYIKAELQKAKSAKLLV